MNSLMRRTSVSVNTEGDISNALRSAGVTPERLLVALATIVERDARFSSSAALSESEEAFLDAHSGVVPSPKALEDFRIQNAIAEEREEASSLTVAEAAQMLDVGDSRVRHRIAEGSLYALPTRGRGISRRLPSWQFVDSEPIPHLSDVVSALPDEFGPFDIKAFFTRAAVDNHTGGNTVGVIEWLVSGGDPEEVLSLANSLRYTL